MKERARVGAISTGVLYLHDLTGLAVLLSKCTKVLRSDDEG